MSENDAIIGLATLVVFGVGAQWIGRRIGIPSLLLLLPAGLLAGDVLDLVEPTELFGDILTPLVTLLVSLLLFHAGIQMRLTELPRRARGAVVRLVTIGLLITFAGATGVIALILDVPTNLAFVAGAILVVSGPTVVGPLLAEVRPREPTGTVLRWEGTALDPIGATLGVVVLNLVLASDRGGLHPVMQMLGRLGLGVFVGLVVAVLLVFVMSKFLLTDDMEAAVALMFAVAAFGLAEVVLSEAGLFATVTMGFVVANQRLISSARITGFGETLEVLIIGILFVLLGALVEIDDLVDNAGRIAVIVVALVLVVRPLTAAVALYRSPLSGRDRALVGWMDPRGIVAAATATQFGASLTDAGFDVPFLLPVTFGVILGTGIVYGLTARPVARRLGVAQPPPAGVALVGDDDWLAAFGQALVDAGVDTLLVTTRSRPSVAAMQGTDRMATSSIGQGLGHVSRAVDDADLARAVVAAESDGALTLLESDLIERVGRRHLLRVPTGPPAGIDLLLPARWVPAGFAGGLHRDELRDRFAEGWRVERCADGLPEGAVLLAIVRADGQTRLRAPASDAVPGDTLVALIRPAAGG